MHSIQFRVVAVNCLFVKPTAPASLGGGSGDTPVGPERKIPWTKPEDLVLGPDFKKLGDAEGFAAPHNGAGLFLFCDSTVKAIKQEIPDKLLRSLLTIDGREIVNESDIPTVDTVVFFSRLQFVRTPAGVKVVGL